MYNLNKSRNDDVEKTETLIVYNSDDYPTCLNNLQDEHYFTETFTILFLFGDDRYLGKREISILFKFWAK